jgi:hypothetical protein
MVMVSEGDFTGLRLRSSDQIAISKSEECLLLEYDIVGLVNRQG